MSVIRVLVILAAVTAVAATAHAQGRGASQRPAKAVAGQGAKQAGKPAKAPKAEVAKATKVAKADKTGAKADTGRADRDVRGTSGDRDAFVERINDTPQQRARLQAMLPTGMTLEQAASGFRNQGQFIAALNASRNQDIPFAQLKAEMTGTNPLSLGDAIQKLRPGSTTP